MAGPWLGYDALIWRRDARGLQCFDWRSQAAEPPGHLAQRCKQAGAEGSDKDIRAARPSPRQAMLPKAEPGIPGAPPRTMEVSMRRLFMLALSTLMLCLIVTTTPKLNAMAEDDGPPAASAGERSQVARDGAQLESAPVGALQDGGDIVQDGAEDGRGIDPAGDGPATVRAGAITGPGTAQQLWALRARGITAATIPTPTHPAAIIPPLTAPDGYNDCSPVRARYAYY